MNDCMFSSNKYDYETPDSLFSQLNNIFKFKIDLAADENNYKVEKYLSVKENSLEDPWMYKGWGWLNPPYGREIDKWISKAYIKKAKVVLLSPSRTETIYFHEFTINADYILFIKGRLIFKGCEHPAPFPSLLAFFGKVSNSEVNKLNNLNLGFLIKGLNL